MKICYILSPKTNGWFFAPWTLTHDNGKDSFFLSKLYIFKNEWVKETQFDSMNIFRQTLIRFELSPSSYNLLTSKKTCGWIPTAKLSFICFILHWIHIYMCFWWQKTRRCWPSAAKWWRIYFLLCFYPCFLVWMTVEYDILILNKAPFELYSCLSILISRDIIHANRTTERRTQFGSVILPVFLHVFFSLFIFIYIQI